MQAGAALERTVYDACPLCGDEAILDVGTYSCLRHPFYRAPAPAEINWCECHRCGHVFTDGYFEGEALALISAVSMPEHLLDADPARNAAIWPPVAAHVATVRGGAAGEWLDVGFGDGALLFAARDAGFTASGIDVRSECVERLRGSGIDVRCATLEDLTEPERFAVVSMADVLEHLPYPRRALEQARRLLAPGGSAFISLPEYGSSAWQDLDRRGKNPYWVEFSHFHNFSRARLEALLRETGFEPEWFRSNDRYQCGLDVVARRI
jgi:SAM-dependent methyltransferase